MKAVKLVFVNTHPQMYPNLGLGYLASYVKKYLPFPVDVCVWEGQGDLGEKIREESADIIGFTASSCYFPENVYKTISLRLFFKGPILLGGPHITSLPTSLPSEMDIGIIGEGEQTLCELLQIFYQKGRFEKEDLQSVKGICFHENGSVKLTPGRDVIEPLDNIPFPDRSLFDMRSYLQPQNILENYQYLRGTSIITSRGCPYQCLYCQPRIMWGSRIRMHSAEYIVEEIKHLYDCYKLEAIVIVDDLFVLDKKRIEGVVEGLSKKGILGKIKFRVQGRANLINDDLMRILKELNTVQLDLGLESGNERVLGYLKGKSVTVEDNKRAIALAGKYGLGIYGLVMIGSPGETREEMMDTLQLLKDPRINTAAVSKTVPLPGTKLWDEVQGDRYIKKLDDWGKLTTGPEEGGLYINEKVPYDEFMRIYKFFKDAADNKRIKNTISHFSIRYIFKAVFTPSKLFRFIRLLMGVFRRTLGSGREMRDDKLNIVYFLEKDYDIVPQRPQLEAMGKHCNLLCVNPPVSVDTIFRSPKKFLNWLKTSKLEKHAFLSVCRPFALTSYGISDRIAVFKIINRWLVGRFIARVKHKMGLNNVIWQITYPQQDYLIGLFGKDPMFYSIRDLVATYSGHAHSGLQKKERSIIKNACAVFVSSESLLNEAKKCSPNTFYSPNGADLDHFRDLKTPAPEDISNIPRPIIGYSGALSEFVDVRLLIDIAGKHPEYSLVLIGLKNCGSRVNKALYSRLFNYPNVYYLGFKKYDDLPKYIKEFDVCLSPYKKCPWVECSFPNKLVQYLAMGKPVVSTDYPAARLFGEVVDVCQNYNEYITAVEKNIDKYQKGEKLAETRRKIAGKYDVSRIAFEKIRILESLLNVNHKRGIRGSY